MKTNQEFELEIKNHLLNSIQTDEKQYLVEHIHQVELWANKFALKFPEVDAFVLSASIWLHDIGRLFGDQEVDHAVNSEVESRRFLKELGVDLERSEQIIHAVRAHRCKDVMPNTLEAKILAAADSASHLTDIVYVYMCNNESSQSAKDKLERDYRDMGILPEIIADVKPLYEAWKRVFELWPAL